MDFNVEIKEDDLLYIDPVQKTLSGDVVIYEQGAKPGIEYFEPRKPGRPARKCLVVVRDVIKRVTPGKSNLVDEILASEFITSTEEKRIPTASDFDD